MWDASQDQVSVTETKVTKKNYLPNMSVDQILTDEEETNYNYRHTYSTNIYINKTEYTNKKQRKVIKPKKGNQK
jgi:hypothetical protein